MKPILPEWTGEAVKLMHIYKIKNVDLAKHMGCNDKYISMILQGKRKPKYAENKIMTALAEMILEKE